MLEPQLALGQNAAESTEFNCVISDGASLTALLNIRI
jgi:hypothetical protein